MANRQNSSHDWPVIEQRYITGEESLRGLAKALNISSSTLTKQAAARKWAAKRRAYRKAQADAQTETVEEEASPHAVAERRARLLGRVADLRDNILDDLLARAL